MTIVILQNKVKSKEKQSGITGTETGREGRRKQEGSLRHGYSGIRARHCPAGVAATQLEEHSTASGGGDTPPGPVHCPGVPRPPGT